MELERCCLFEGVDFGEPFSQLFCCKEGGVADVCYKSLDVLTFFVFFCCVHP